MSGYYTSPYCLKPLILTAVAQMNVTVSGSFAHDSICFILLCIPESPAFRMINHCETRSYSDSYTVETIKPSGQLTIRNEEGFS